MLVKGAVCKRPRALTALTAALDGGSPLVKRQIYEMPILHVFVTDESLYVCPL